MLHWLNLHSKGLSRRGRCGVNCSLTLPRGTCQGLGVCSREGTLPPHLQQLPFFWGGVSTALLAGGSSYYWDARQAGHRSYLGKPAAWHLDDLWGKLGSGQAPLARGRKPSAVVGSQVQVLALTLGNEDPPHPCFHKTVNSRTEATPCLSLYPWHTVGAS